MSDKWDERFLELAKTAASWSKDPSTKVGAVLTCGKQVLSIGWNGFPPGVHDYPHLLKDREAKYPRVVHAEMNAILRMPPNFGLRYLRLFTTHFPCANCGGAIITAGIKEIVTQKPSADMLERWGDAMRISEEMFRETGVRVLYL